ncbi:hypothetical protein PHET_07125 [Paragonimus heterotremus]|uniref:Uncharacterized protein n=1 Tax=Paragonimus heterotremus TaxID=100268 RepID=A0A8J4SNC9_9TREM|nr:hypothetical protein PHET_07125 [Paragonimus heterotremus]
MSCEFVQVFSRFSKINRSFYNEEHLQLIHSLIPKFCRNFKLFPWYPFTLPMIKSIGRI